MPISRAPAPFELSLRPGDELFELTRKGAYIVVGAEGVHIGRSSRRLDATFVSYDEITHVVPTRRGLWIGTRSTVLPLARGRKTPLHTRDVTRAIEARIARRPGGANQLARFREVDQTLTRGRGRILVVMVMVLCVVAHALQIGDQFISEVGILAPDLVAEGELWRVVTAHFLHVPGVPPVEWLWLIFGPLSPWLPFHIAVNTALALLFAHLVEQPLGRLRTAIVLGAAAAGAVLASYPGGANVLGASGMVLGLAGAAFAMELHTPERLPAPWRIPRRFFVVVMVLEAGTGFLLDFVAGWAHIGGFAGGYLAGRVLAPGALLDQPEPLWARPVVTALAVAVIAALLSAMPLARRDVGAMNRHAARVLDVENVSPGTMNDLAWRIATETEAGPADADYALELAQRAVDETEAANPDFLDTLAEVQFMAGDALAALATIEQAIDLAPWEEYFRGQRARFSGLRDPEDRPAAPALPWSARPRREPDWVSEDGLEI